MVYQTLLGINVFCIKIVMDVFKLILVFMFMPQSLVVEVMTEYFNIPVSNIDFVPSVVAYSGVCYNV